MHNKTGLVLLLFLALPAPSLGVTRIFHYVELTKTWTEAQSYCRENGVDLVTIENEEDWLMVKNMIGSRSAWIGLYKNMDWKWSIDNTPLYVNGNTGYGEWFDFVLDSGDHCVVFFKGKLHDETCGVLRNSVCYDEPTRSYILVTDVKNWESALKYCREQYTDLTAVRSQQEMEEITRLIPLDAWWVGLSQLDWRWSDQSKSLIRKWTPPEPNENGHENCAGSTSNGWYNVDCDRTNKFICSVPIMKLFKVAVKSEESVDMNDPQVQEALLIQLEKHLKDHGIDPRFRLRWRKQPNGKIFDKMKPEQST